MEYQYNGENYLLDQENYEDKLYEVIYQFTHRILDGQINRYDVIVDPESLQKTIITSILEQIPTSTIIDLSTFNTKDEYLILKEELLKQDKVLITINQNSLIAKLDRKTKEEQERYFYNLIINFLCDSYTKKGINYQEIMFFTNDEYRRYIKYAHDISSRSNTIFFNSAYHQERNKSLTLDDALESKYRGI